MESHTELTEPHFDKYIRILKLFDTKNRKEQVDTINIVRKSVMRVYK